MNQTTANKKSWINLQQGKIRKSEDINRKCEAISVQERSTWVDEKEYPFSSHYWELDGCRMHYVDEGKGEQSFLFVHGSPHWSFAFRNIIKGLRNSHRCVAPDLPGFGLSDYPIAQELSPPWHSEILEKFVLEKDLRDIILVVHNYGGPIGLDFATRHPERIRGIIAFNTWLSDGKDDPAYNFFYKLNRGRIVYFAYKVLNFVVKYLLPRVFLGGEFPKNIHEHYARPFSSKTRREIIALFSYFAFHRPEWFREIWENTKRTLQNKPVLLLWGTKDPFIKPFQMEKFFSTFADVSKKEFSCGHLPFEECPQEVLEAIQEYLKVEASSRS